jgi:hypothetical protein
MDKDAGWESRSAGSRPVVQLMGVTRMRIARKSALPLALACATALATGLPAVAQADEIIVRISKVKALDKIDEASQADFYAQVIISGEQFAAEPIKDRNEIRPNWVFTKKVAPGQHDVKITLLDKDLTRDDPVDINRLANKRDLDFTVNTLNCTITGFAQPYKCRTAISRGGTEKKRAEITFSVDVKR